MIANAYELALTVVNVGKRLFSLDLCMCITDCICAWTDRPNISECRKRLSLSVRRFKLTKLLWGRLTRTGNGIVQATGGFKKAAMPYRASGCRELTLLPPTGHSLKKGWHHFWELLSSVREGFLPTKTLACARTALPPPPPSSLPKSLST